MADFKKYLGNTMLDLARASLVYAAAEHDTSTPTTMQILDALDRIAEGTKSGIRAELLQDERNALAERKI